jgi:8-oxo-dGTP pyrophosphatase MutT (NUDIX family)
LTARRAPANLIPYPFTIIPAWRRLQISLALTGRLTRLAERLANRAAASTDDAPLIWAAVTVVVSPDPDSILLIRRADRAGDPWSGHMALPGGRREPADQDLLSTAIRETHEELGFELARSQLVGSLDDVVPRTPVLPPVAVRPFVFLVPGRLPLTLNSEVAAAHWVSLDDLQQPGRHQAVTLDIAGMAREVQAFRLDNGVVWGMTERILASLLEQFRD